MSHAAPLPHSHGITVQPEIQPIPGGLARELAPATHYLYEWTDYWLKCPGADAVTPCDSTPLAPNLFRLRFENHLGLTVIQPMAGRRPCGQPLQVEVISPKFPDVAGHVAFFRSLLDDLFARAARLPFTFSAATQRGVSESLRPPTPLFTLHFLCQHTPILRMAMTVVQAMPHRRLCDHPDLVPLAEAVEADADVLISALRTPHEWQPARGFPLAERLGGRAPARVWQRRTEETLDTLENRFVLDFARQVLAAADALPAQRWWGNVPRDRQAIVRDIGGLLRQAIHHPMFAEVGPMRHFPAASQVLMQREGYREMLNLWHLFHQARRPLFAPLQQAIEVRDIATLYEFWAFFALVEEITVALKESPVLELRSSDDRGLEWQAAAQFGRAGTLVYNQKYSRGQGTYRSNSLSLRPDFTWLRHGRPEVVLDAKFRLERQTFEDAEDDTQAAATARVEDLYKMHTYRDALSVRAAISVYPGDIPIFYDRARGRLSDMTLRNLLLDDYYGVGALALQPI